MAKVKFTSAVDERFGGGYTTPHFTAKKDEIWLLDEKYAEQIQRDHCGLPDIAVGKGDAKKKVKQRDLIKVLDKAALPPEGMRAQLVGEPAVGGN